MVRLGEHVARVSLSLFQGATVRRVETSVGTQSVLSFRGRTEGPPVVLLHGLSAAAVTYYPLIKELHREVGRLFVPDMPGHGFSATPTVLDERTLCAGAHETIDRLVTEPAVLIGNSLGGYVALRYALERPERVRALVLISPAGAAASEEEFRALRDTFAMETHADALAFIDRLLAKKSGMRHLYAWGTRRYFRRPEVRDLLEADSHIHLLRPEELSELRTPTLLIWGREEHILPEANFHFFRAHLPGHVVIERPEGFGHSPFLDDAPALARRLLEFYRAQS